ncbi:hypothetical protein NG795_09735 [Laspinema sp. D3]|nr:hypothetical protein [Laspinema sp. D2c]
MTAIITEYGAVKPSELHQLQSQQVG